MSRSLSLLSLVLASGCAAQAHNIPGTNVANSEQNQAIIDTVEKYRLALEAKDDARLLTMASRDYWEDGGTPSGADDFGYDGLREVLKTRFQRADRIRYSLKYVAIERKDRKAYVTVLIDASYSIPTAHGPSPQPLSHNTQARPRVLPSVRRRSGR